MDNLEEIQAAVNIFIEKEEDLEVDIGEAGEYCDKASHLKVRANKKLSKLVDNDISLNRNRKKRTSRPF